MAEKIEETIKHLIEEGRKKGFLTYSEMNKLLEEQFIPRERMDQFAKQSQDRAVAAQESGFFDREIVPFTKEDGEVRTKDMGLHALPWPREQLLELAGVGRGPLREVEAAVGPPVTHGAGDGVLLRGRQARVDLEGNDAVGPPVLAERNDDRTLERLAHVDE